MSRGPQDLVNYVKLELWVIDWDFTTEPAYGKQRKQQGKEVSPAYLMMRAVTVGPTFKCGANFHVLVAIGDMAERVKAMDLKKGDHVLVEGRLGYKYSKRYGRQYRVFIDTIQKLPDEEMPLYDYMRGREHPLDAWKTKTDLKGLRDKREGRSVVAQPALTLGEDEEEVPF
jgi:hypothetical protein